MKDTPAEMRYYGATSWIRSWDLGELWRYRELLFTLCLRDIQVQYRQSFLGVGWAIVRPLMLMIVFTWLFKLLGRVPAADESQYAVSLFAGLLPWQLFAVSLAAAASCLVANEHLITKVYFPRLILVLVPLGVALVDFAIAFFVLLVMMLFSGVEFAPRLLLLPCFVLLAMFSSIALSTWMSAANALYRDIRHAVPFVIQVGMLLSPVIYETRELIPDRWMWLYQLNPMATVIDGFRWCVLGTTPPTVSAILIAMSMVAVLLISGLVFFRSIDRVVADRV